MTNDEWRIIPALIFTLLVCVPYVVADDPGQDEVYLSAGDYLADQYRLKDVILLGENHRIREHQEFVARMIPMLHRNGVNLLFSEFALAADSALIDSLITGRVYNESLARYIAWRDSWDWAYPEYLEVYRAAWEVNRTLQPGEERFRIIGLEQDVPMHAEPEEWWARLIRRYSLDRNRKALVWCGLHHSFSRYFQPYVINDSVGGFVTTRVGNYLYRSYPFRVISIFLHAPLRAAPGEPTPYVAPCFGKIDSVAGTLPEGHREIGFSTNETWLGRCSLENTFYATGYVGFRLENFCQGYIVIKPVCDLTMDTVIPGFINAQNVVETRVRAGLGKLTPEAFNDTIRQWLADESRFLAEFRKSFCTPSR